MCDYDILYAGGLSYHITLSSQWKNGISEQEIIDLILRLPKFINAGFESL